MLSWTKRLFVATSALMLSVPAGAGTPPPFTFQALLNLIRDRGAKTVEQVIPLLPDAYKHDPILIFHSRSLQEGTPEHPRVVLYGNTAIKDTIYPNQNPDRLYIAFQTDTAPESNSESLEVIEWNPYQRSYAFHDVELNGKSVTEATNQECAHCHGNPSRPNWTAYPDWPGVFADHDKIHDDSEKTNYTEKEVNTFIGKLVAENPRLDGLDFSGYLTKDGPLPSDRPLINITSKIGDQLILRGVPLIESSPDFEKYKFAFAGAFIGCLNFDEFFPENVLSSLQRGLLSSVQTDPLPPALVPVQASDLTFPKAVELTERFVEKRVHFLDYGEEVIQTTWLRFLFEGRGRHDLLRNLFGSPTSNKNDPRWNLDFASIGQRVADGLAFQFLKDENHVKGLGGLGPLAHDVLLDSVRTYGPDGVPRPVNRLNAGACSTLAKKSFDALKN